MIRRAAIFMLIAVFTLATTPSFACTGISLKAKDGAAIRGRTLEFGFPMGSNVIVIPAGKDFSGTLPDGGKGLALRWYFRTFADQSIRMVDLKEAIEAAKGEIKTISMEASKQLIANVSADVKSDN